MKASGGQAFHVRELPYEQSSGYETFVQLIREVAGIFESDANPVAMSKLRGLLGSASVWRTRRWSSSCRSSSEPPEAVADDRRSLFEAARRYVEAFASAGGTLIVFEDVHWAHASTLDLITSLAGRARDALDRLPRTLATRSSSTSGRHGAAGCRRPPRCAWNRSHLPRLIGSPRGSSGRVSPNSPSGSRPRRAATRCSSKRWPRGCWNATASSDDLPTTVRAMIAARLDVASPRGARTFCSTRLRRGEGVLDGAARVASTGRRGPGRDPRIARAARPDQDGTDVRGRGRPRVRLPPHLDPRCRLRDDPAAGST